ncbi:capsule biosynthesis protein [Kordiimonas pumila]|uniref:Capsule biosynthesis protein n=1 Tax=Kordiimonas pumila TaxID=2161677 RepID=A0ABV7D4U8_9PROT|nr:capsular biosynthesis protein [Kordiimonas pumila]
MPDDTGLTLPPTTARTFLVLQGLSTRFFTVLSNRLAAEGHKVYRVHFCGGDWLLARGSTAVSHIRFKDTPENLEHFYSTTLKEKAITDIILFGDCRPIHKTAIAVAKKHSIAVHVFEEGYTRPHWVTLEVGGTNDHSPLPRSAEVVLEKAAALTTEETLTDTATPIPNPMVARVFWDLAFHAGRLGGKPFYPHYKTHRPNDATDELIGWFGRFWRKLQHGDQNKALLAHYKKYHEQYFLVPLQLNSDFQIREHSNYPNVPTFIMEVIQSFAAHASKKSRLLFKMHPLDNGIIDYRFLITDLARQYKISKRVDYVEGGDLDMMLMNAKGAVMINSTVGFKALQLSIPIKVMGRAFYDMAGLSAQGPLDSFWENPEKPDPELVAAFIKLVRTESQLYGDFFTRKGMALVVESAVKKLLAQIPNTQESPKAL